MSIARGNDSVFGVFSGSRAIHDISVALRLSVRPAALIEAQGWRAFIIAVVELKYYPAPSANARARSRRKTVSAGDSATNAGDSGSARTANSEGRQSTRLRLLTSGRFLIRLSKTLSRTFSPSSDLHCENKMGYEEKLKHQERDRRRAAAAVRKSDRFWRSLLPKIPRGRRNQKPDADGCLKGCFDGCLGCGLVLAIVLASIFYVIHNSKP